MQDDRLAEVLQVRPWIDADGLIQQVLELSVCEESVDLAP